MILKEKNTSNQILLIGLTFIVLAQLATSINITSSKYIIQTIPIVFLLESRFIIGVVFLMLFSLFLSQTKKQKEFAAIKKLNGKQWLVLLGQTLVGGVLFNLIMLIGLQYTSATMAGVITSILPAMVITFMFLILGIQLTRLKIICVFLAILGLFIISVSRLNQSSGLGGKLLGDFIVFLALVPESLYYVFTKLMPLNIKPLTASIIINFINALLLSPALLFLDYSFFNNLHYLEWSILCLLGVMSGLIYLFWPKGMQYLEASTVGILTALMPIFTLILASFFLNESINWLQGLSMLLIINSIIIGNWQPNKIR